MIELYLDTVDIDQIRRFNTCMPLKGITTNPSILARSGMGLSAMLPEVAEIIGNNARFHVQVVSQSLDAIIEEAR